MQYKVYDNNINELKTECLILFINNTKKNLFDFSLLPDNLYENIKNILKTSNFSGEYKDILFSYLPNDNIKSILFIGLGNIDEINRLQFKKTLKKIIINIKKYKFEKIAININELLLNRNSKLFSENSIYKDVVESIEYENYEFNNYKSKKSPINSTLIHFISNKIVSKNKIINDIITSKKINDGISFARDLGNQPPNICTPSYLAEVAENLSQKHKNINLQIIEEEEMKSLGMGALLAVSAGSPNPPKMIIFEYKNEKAANKKPIIMVGKGITFDTGGNSLKPSNSMVGMKYDMCGAAAVLGVVKIISDLKLPINFIGVLACAENTPGGKAARPDDIVKTHAGIFVEILNTDAEGRLVLCDALSYVKKYNPEIVVDIATLTGACVVALGREYSGLFSNDDGLANDFSQAGKDSNDKCWRLPINKAYSRQLKSNFADIANIGGEAGSITAACFLYQFIKEFKWAHLDVAGTAGIFSGNNKQSTGRPIPLLIQFLLNKIYKK